jgi:hypothetical protein
MAAPQAGRIRPAGSLAQRGHPVASPQGSAPAAMRARIQSDDHVFRETTISVLLNYSLFRRK